MKSANLLRKFVLGIEFMAAATAVLLAVVAIIGYFQVSVPVIEISESCDLSPLHDEATSDELIMETAGRLWDFYETIDDFAIENQGRIVYADIAIDASSSSLGCAIAEGQLARYLDLPEIDQSFWISTDDSDPWASEFSLTVRGPYGGSWRLEIPVNQRELPKNGQYRAIDHGHLLSVEGPFFVEHLEANGIGLVRLYPQEERVLTEAEISCARRRLHTPDWLRTFVPCF